MEGILTAAKNALGLNSKPSVPLAGSANIPPAAVNVPNKKAASPPVNKMIEKVNALKPAGVKMPNVPASANAPANASANAARAAAPAVSATAYGGTLSDFIGGARRRKNLRKKYKMPGRRAATRKSRKTASRKARRSTTRKNRRASRKARK